MFITIVFCLPTVNPVTVQSLNYTPVAVGIVLVGILGSWFLFAHKWFTGPIRQIELARSGVNIDDPAAVAAADEKKGLVNTESKADT
jgi:hypothetical protein